TRSSRDWSSDVCSSDLSVLARRQAERATKRGREVLAAGESARQRHLQDAIGPLAQQPTRNRQALPRPPFPRRHPHLEVKAVVKRSEERRGGEDCRGRAT